MNPVRNQLALPGSLAVTILAAVLSGCGGSSSSSSSSNPGPSLEAPEGLVAAPANGQVELDWEEVENATGYNVYYSTEDLDLDNPDTGAGSWEKDAGRPFLADDLDNYETYSFVVTATIDEDEGPPSNEVTARPAPGISGHTKVISDDQPVGAGEYTDVGATCGPTGLVAISGGIAGPDDLGSTESPELVLQESYPATVNPGTGPQSIWVTGVLNEGAEAIDVKAYAICIEAPDDFQIEDRLVTLPAGAYEDKSVSCPGDDQVAIGKAIAAEGVSGKPDLLIHSHNPSSANISSRWNFRLSNNAAESRQVTLSAICAREPLGYERESRHGSQVGANSYGRKTATCDTTADPVVLSGGFRTAGTTDDHPHLLLEESYPVITDAGVHRWRAGIRNTLNKNMSWWAYAICAEREP